MSLVLDCRQVGDVTVIDLTGRLQLGEDSLRILLDTIEKLTSTKWTKILLNFKLVRKVDDASLNELDTIKTRLENQGGQLKAYNFKSASREARILAKLAQVFGYDETDQYHYEAAAIRSFH